MSEQDESFAGWAVVEVMGHRRYAGYVSSQLLAGASLVRVDVPEATRRYGADAGRTLPAYTKLIGVASIYMLTPCSEDVARKAAEEIAQYDSPFPVALPQLAAGSVADDDGDVEVARHDDPDWDDDDAD